MVQFCFIHFSDDHLLVIVFGHHVVLLRCVHVLISHILTMHRGCKAMPARAIGQLSHHLFTIEHISVVGKSLQHVKRLT